MALFPLVFSLFFGYVADLVVLFAALALDLALQFAVVSPAKNASSLQMMMMMMMMMTILMMNLTTSIADSRATVD